jgi:hypothetical protein
MSVPNWYTIIYSSLLLVSVILYIVSFFISGTSKLGCLITAYSTIAVGILMILGFTLNNVSKIAGLTHPSNWEYFKIVLSNTGPFIISLGIIFYTLYLLIVYQNRISNNHVTTEYSTFSSISIILTLTKLYLFYKGINSKIFLSTGKMSKISYSIMYLIGILNLICVLIMGTILKYFTTDG